jgi:PKD repeat protein
MKKSILFVCSYIFCCLFAHSRTMKRFLLLFMTVCFYQLQGQNIVPNPGFEIYSALPTSVAQLNLCIGWNSCYGGGSPDYFHYNGTGLVKLPNCFIGTVNAHSDSAIVGAALWYYSPASYREYIATKLAAPMVIGQTYNVSFYITNGVTSGTYGGGGIDQVSVLFSMDSLFQPGTGPINRTPQYTNGTVFYSHTWQLMSFNYVADSAYQYITIGNFKNDAGTIYQQFDTCTAYGAYYFFDDINVHPASNLPVANFISSDTSFCNESGKCIHFTDHSTGNPTSWKWLFPGAIPDSSLQQNPDSICYYTPGTYPVTLIVTNSNGTDTLAVSPMITLSNPPSVPTTSISNDTIYCSHAAAYQWYFNGSPIAGATDSFYVYSSVGTYSVQISDGNGCNVLSGGILITGLAPSILFNREEVTVYPNPAGDELVISEQSIVVKKIEIYSVFGENVYFKDMEPAISNTGLKINTSGFTDGIYFIRVFTPLKVLNKKVIIKS